MRNLIYAETNDDRVRIQTMLSIYGVRFEIATVGGFARAHTLIEAFPVSDEGHKLVTTLAGVYN